MKARRVRRSRSEAREAILDAAEAILREEGPEGVVVQKVAAAVGVTDAAVHYHFGNRVGLMEALLHHCGRKLAAEIAEAIATDGGPPDLAGVSRAMRRTYGDNGGGRMAMWLRLAGWRPRGAGMLSPLVARAEASGGADARRLLALLNAVHVGVAIMGEALLRAADLPSDPAGEAAFLDWTTELVAQTLRGAR